MPIDKRKNAILLAVLLTAVFACSLAYAFGFHIQPTVDARWYDTIAWNLASGKGFRLLDSGPLSGDPAIGTVGPGYEYLLAGVYGFFGRRLEPVWILQALLHTLNAFLVFFLARRVIPESPRQIFFSMLAATFYGLNPDLILMAAMLFTETLYLTFLLLAALGIATVAIRPSARAAFATAIALACAILVRPIALLPLAVFLVLLVIKKKPPWVLGVLLIQLVFIAPWAWRNYSVYGRFIPLTAAGGYDLWVGNNPEANGEEIPVKVVSDYKDQYGFLQADRYGAEQYVKFLLGDPIGFLKLQGIKTVKFFSVIRTSAWWFHLSGIARGITFLLSAGFFFLLLLMGISGIYSALRTGPAPARILAVLALTVPAAVIPIVVTSRLRYPMYPFLAVLGALAAFRYREGEISRRSILLSGGLIAAFTLMDILISAPEIPGRILRLFS
jgi:hypothetical protein